MLGILIAVILPVFHLLGIISAVHAVMTARTPQGSIAWAVSLLLMPVLAVPAYWVFGRSRFNGYVTARRSGHVTIREKLGQVLDQVAPWRLPNEEIGPVGDAAQRLADLPFLQGNRVELLIDGEATFESILAGMDAAESYILFQFFIVKDDEIGREVQRRLMARARAGVRVCFLYDEIGSHDLPKTYLNNLRQAGIEVHPFHTRKGKRNRFQVNFRNHRKVVVVDGKAAWIGGHNVGDEYLGRDPRFGHWRDTHIRITGPAVMPVQISFVEDWNWAAGTPIPEISWTPTSDPDGNQSVLVVPTGPADPMETAALMFHQAINAAEKRIWIASPYFVPDDAILSALQLAGVRGVDVRILIPDMADHLLVYLAAFTYFDDVSRTGVRFFRYSDGFLHQKVMLIDDRNATVGTANFDNRSFRLNFEITAVVLDRLFAEQIEHMLEQDFARSKEMFRADVDNRSFLQRLGSRFARLTSPIQ